MDSKKIGKNPGELYFMGEVDFLTKVPSENIKIGLVRGLPEEGTTVKERIKHHQTGNSRELDPRQSMVSNSISPLESIVHQHLATARLHGEWFVLPGDDLQKAVAIANGIESNLKSMAKVVQNSLELTTVESDGSIIKPTDSDIDLHNEILALRAQKREVEKINSAHVFDFASEVQNCYGIAGIAHWKANAIPDAAFNKVEFQRQDPDFAKKLAKLSELATGQLRILGEAKVPASPKPPKPTGVDQLIEDENHLDRTKNHEQIHDEILVNLVEISRLELKLIEKEAELKTRIGTSSGIEGLATWKRERKPELPGDTEEIVKSKSEELWKKCHKRRTRTVSLELFDYRPYLSDSHPFRIL